MNYGELKALIITYAHRTDLSVNNLIDTLVENAATRIGRDCRMQEMERVATLTVDGFAGLPDGFMGLRSITKPKANGLINLIQTTSMQFEQLSEGDDFYCIKNGQIHINGQADITINYMKRPSELTVDAGINFVLLSAPNLYLYGSLMEVFIYAQDTDAFTQYEGLYNQEVERVNTAADKQKYSGALQLRRVD